MKALTLWQPYAELIMVGVKTAETRSWPAPPTIIGTRIAIHAAQKTVGRHWGTEQLDRAYRAIRSPSEDYRPEDAFELLNRLPRGDVIGSAVVSHCFQVVEHLTISGRDEYASNGDGHLVRIDEWGDYSIGRYIWTLDSVVRLRRPVPAKGFQRIWEWRRTKEQEADAT